MHTRARWGFLFVAVWGSINACGNDSTDDHGSGGTSIGRQGGEVSAGALTLSIPGDALSAPVNITVDETTMISAPSGLVLVGPAYDLGPDGTQFAKPVVVTIELDTVMTAALDLVTLYHSSNGTSWSPAENSTFDKQAGVVSGGIRHFSFVAPFAATVSGQGGAPQTGGSGGVGGASSGCSANLTECAGACVDVQNDAEHCGSCQNVCSPGESCESGQCFATSAGGEAGATGAAGASAGGAGGAGEAGATFCGDGVPEGTEECDDGNYSSGDGCSPLCKLEFFPN